MAAPTNSSWANSLVTEVAHKIFLDYIGDAIAIGAARREGEFQLPSLKKRFQDARVLAQVCSLWREISLGLPELWNGLYLTGTMSSNDCDYDRISQALFERSQPISLHLDIEFEQSSADAASNVVRRKDPFACRSIWDEILGSDVLSRCVSLRVKGKNGDIGEILRVFTKYNRQAPKSCVLKELHVVQDHSSTSTSSKFFLDRFNAVEISPNLVSLKTSKSVFRQYPQRQMEEVVLKGIEMEGGEYYEFIAGSMVRRLTLRNILIPPYSPRGPLVNAMPGVIDRWRKGPWIISTRLGYGNARNRPRRGGQNSQKFRSLGVDYVSELSISGSRGGH